ncbi:uncharacterized protein LOC135842654 [Planococcus citri]|uniref:uncharacterized protein LOC135842654 n=1 Tax=Planococcus citri TaxID=170843 RepID=UPI0031F9BA91
MAMASSSSAESTESPKPKRIKICSPENSITLKILDDRSNRIVELDDGADGVHVNCQTKPTTMAEIEEMLDKVWFQDNTMSFKDIISGKSFTLLLYPHGSGKTTLALLLRSFLSVERWSPKLKEFFENCELAKLEKEFSDEYKNGSKVVYISFEDIQGDTEEEFEDSLGEIMQKLFRIHTSNTVYEEIRSSFVKKRSYVYFSLARLMTELIEKSKIAYLIVDSCDTVYNRIAHFPNAVEICEQFRYFLRRAVPKCGITVVKLFCFGVSSFLIEEFASKAYIHSIFSSKDENGLSRYFSYNSNTIDAVIKAWNLPTSVAECERLAMFQYNNNKFINAGICVPFLKCLKDGKKHFQVDIVPRSLWPDCVFSFDDHKLLLDLLNHPVCELEFNMCLSMYEIIGRLQNPDLYSDRRFFYPLLIYNGLLSSEHVIDNKYSLTIANETSRCVLIKSLDEKFIQLNVLEKSI